MACHGIYKSGGRRIGSICGPTRDGPKRFCLACRRVTDLLCDGPRDPARCPEVDDEHDEKKLCSRPVCDRCAVSLRALDLDFCPTCARGQTVGECQLRTLGPSLSPLAICCGTLVAKASLCLRHTVLFDHWHAFEGGEAVYADASLNREQRRDEHRRWLRTTDDQRLEQILHARHAPAKAVA